MMKKNKQRGFTLVEALVVIAILGLLGVFFLINFNVSGKKSRDQRRISDIQVIMQALELYRDKYGYYPGPGAENPAHKVPNSGEVIGAGGFIDQALTEFITIPTDPFYSKYPAVYYYAYDPTHVKDDGDYTAVIGAHKFEYLEDSRETSNPSGPNQDLCNASYNRLLSENGKQNP